MDWVLVTAMLFMLIGFVAWLAMTGWQRRQRVRLASDFITRLLDRLGSAKDLSDFLQSGAGIDFMRALGSDIPASKPQDWIIRATQIGMVLLPLGIGLFCVARFVAFTDADPPQFFAALGVIVVSLGIGFIVSALAAHRLALTLGVLRRPEH